VTYVKALLASFLKFCGFMRRPAHQSVLAASATTRNIARIDPRGTFVIREPTTPSRRPFASRLTTGLLPTELTKRARTVPASGFARSLQYGSS
jgi:hypothetical protein